MSQVTVPETKGSRIFNIPDNDAGGKICLKYEASDPFKIGNKYGSIPANLLTNVAVWFVLMVKLGQSLQLTTVCINPRFCSS